jgi:hypothetical protein
MINKVKEILKHDIQAVIKSPELSLSLLKCASVLYLNGDRPRACESAQRKYYSQLKKDGIMKAELAEAIKNRTCVPGWKGRMYSTVVMTNIFPQFLTDEKAIEYLNNGALKESHFEVLPEGYKQPADEAPKAEKEELIVVKKKKRGRPAKK